VCQCFCTALEAGRCYVHDRAPALLVVSFRRGATLAA
jgi:hypothetical protein